MYQNLISVKVMQIQKSLNDIRIESTLMTKNSLQTLQRRKSWLLVIVLPVTLQISFWNLVTQTVFNFLIDIHSMIVRWLVSSNVIESISLDGNTMCRMIYGGIWSLMLTFGVLGQKIMELAMASFTRTVIVHTILISKQS